MYYFDEIGHYMTYSGQEADLHFSYNANSGGGQAFLGGRFLNSDGQLSSPEELDGKKAIFTVRYTNSDGHAVVIALDDVKCKYDIKPRGNGSTSMKLGIGNDRVAPSKVISAFAMLPPTCGIKMPSNLDLSILSANNYWLQSMWLECTESADTPGEVSLFPIDYVFCGGMNRAGQGRCRYFKLRITDRIRDIGRISHADVFPEEIQSGLRLFADIYSGSKAFQYDECEAAVRAIMLSLAKEYPDRYSGIGDPLPVLVEAASSACTASRCHGTGANILLYGVPGCGKSHEIKTRYCNDESRMERVVFHPDYTYSDLVGQIMPSNEAGHISYPFVPGPFTRILKKAVADPANNYFLIIEEINRGNAPAIFGEIFQLLDRIDGESEYGISNIDIAREVYGDATRLVKIPANLYILATMNTADQNVFTLDTAFKRRWTMRCIPNDFSQCKLSDIGICGTEVTWRAFAEKINGMIIDLNEGDLGGEDKRLGAYFVSADELSDRTQFGEKVLMYLWNDAFRYDHDKVFRSEYKTLEQLLAGFDQSLFGVFLDTVVFPQNAAHASDVAEVSEDGISDDGAESNGER